MDNKVRYWVCCGDYRQPIAIKRAKAALDCFSKGIDGEEEALILADGDPRLKNYKDFTTMDVE